MKIKLYVKFGFTATGCLVAAVNTTRPSVVPLQDQDDWPHGRLPTVSVPIVMEIPDQVFEMAKQVYKDDGVYPLPERTAI